MIDPKLVAIPTEVAIQMRTDARRYRELCHIASITQSSDPAIDEIHFPTVYRFAHETVAQAVDRCISEKKQTREEHEGD